MKTTSWKTVIGAVVSVITIATTAQAQNPKARLELVPRDQLPPIGNYWLAKGPTGTPMPPFPNPPADLDVPIYALGNGEFLVDDSKVDYVARKKEADALKALRVALGMETEEDDPPPPPGGGGGGGGGWEPLPRDPNGLYLDIAEWPFDGKLIWFNSKTGLVYNVQQSTDLVNWSAYKTIVADDTNESFFLYDAGQRFFRVVQLDDRVKFPNWDDEVEQYVHFEVSTSIQGTYQIQLYEDGQLVYQTNGAVPVSGLFGVHDASYNPANWPSDSPYTGNT